MSQPTLIWNQAKLRIDGAISVLSKLLSAKKLNQLKEHLPNLDGISSSELIEYFAVISEIENSEEALIQFVEFEFLNHFSKIRLFHGCRPINLNSYLEQGILKNNQNRLENEARNIFSETNPSKQLLEKLEDAILELGELYTPYKKRVFLIVDDRVLLETAGHYLINGSEYLLAIAVRVPCQNMQDLLRKRGTPTIIFCDIPTIHIRTKIRRLWLTIVLDYLYHLGGFDISTDPLDYTVTMDHVPPNLISGHYHPTVIKDPHNSYITYRPELTKCSHCTPNIKE